jgi:excisionase family DNA binding protein
MQTRPQRTVRLVRDQTDLAPTGPDVLLTIQEVAARLKIGRETAYGLARRGAIPTIRFPGSRFVRVPARAHEEWIRRRTSTP